MCLVKAGGSNYEIGHSVGRTARKLLVRSLENYRLILAAEGWTGPWIMPEGYLAAARETYPHLVEELEGMAAGSGLSFNDLFFLNSLEEALEITKPASCTAIAISRPGEVWLGHNEDWYAVDRDAIIVISARPQGKPAFVSVTAAPFIAAVGMNELGLAQGVNSVESLDCTTGVPGMFAARAVLEASSLEEAQQLAAPGDRAGGYNHLLALGSGEIGNLETTATAVDYLPGKELVYHTNHYISARLGKLAAEPSEHSLSRYNRLAEMEHLLKESSSARDALIGVLSDHGNSPDSICRHPREQIGSEGTIFSVVFNLNKLQSWVAVGNPCGNIFKEVYL